MRATEHYYVNLVAAFVFLWYQIVFQTCIIKKKIYLNVIYIPTFDAR